MVKYKCHGTIAECLKCPYTDECEREVSTEEIQFVEEHNLDYSYKEFLDSKKNKTYNSKRKEYVSEYNKKYRQEHLEYYKKYNKKYYKEHKEEISQKKKNKYYKDITIGSREWKRVVIDGKPLKQLAEEMGISYNALYKRYRRRTAIFE